MANETMGTMSFDELHGQPGGAAHDARVHGMNHAAEHVVPNYDVKEPDTLAATDPAALHPTPPAYTEHDEASEGPEKIGDGDEDDYK